MKPLLFLLVGLLCSQALADYPLEIIEIRSRPADEMIPLIKPFISQDGSIAALNSKLIVRTSPENLSEIQRLLGEIDQPLQNLMIYVRQSTGETSVDQGLSAGVSTMIGKNAKVGVGHPTASGTGQIQIRQAHTRDGSDITQRVRALEGRPAFIATGQAIPVEEQHTSVSGNLVLNQSSTRYLNATTGFYVIPRLNGDQVTLEISPHSVRSGNRQERLDVQFARTRIRGALNQWITVAGSDDRLSQNHQGILRDRRTRSRDYRQIQLMVERLP